MILKKSEFDKFQYIIIGRYVMVMKWNKMQHNETYRFKRILINKNIFLLSSLLITIFVVFHFYG